MSSPAKLLLSLATSALLSTAAYAVPDLSFGDYRGPISIEWDNWESFTGNPSGMVMPGDRNFGLISVTRVIATDGSGGTLWRNGDSGQEMWGVFRNITVSGITPSASGVYLDSIGGELDLYLNPFGSAAGVGGAAQGSSGYADAGCTSNTLCYHGITDATDAVLALSLRWVVGIAPEVSVRGLFTSFAPPEGTATGYMEVTGGRYAELFNSSDLLDGGADMLFNNRIYANGLDGHPTGDWQLLSVGTLAANVVAEPGSAALAGLALAGLALRRRQRGTATTR